MWGDCIEFHLYPPGEGDTFQCRKGGSLHCRLTVLKAVGVNKLGQREVLGVSCSLSEAEVHWRTFLENLLKRGLKGVELIISDDHSGLRAALRATLPSVPWQRCLFHLAQNAQSYAPNQIHARRDRANRERYLSGTG